MKVFKDNEGDKTIWYVYIPPKGKRLPTASRRAPTRPDKRMGTDSKISTIIKNAIATIELNF